MIIVSGTIDELLNVTGNAMMSINPQVPAVLTVPDTKRQPPTKRGIYLLSDYATGNATIATDETACRWCKSTDIWESATVPGRMTCRKCHPPAPGSERKPSNTPVIQAIGE